MTALYIAGAVVLPVVLVVVFLGFDRMLQVAQQRRRIVWPLIVLTQVFGLAARAMEGSFGLGFALHVLLVAVALFSWNYESGHPGPVEEEHGADTPTA